MTRAPNDVVVADAADQVEEVERALLDEGRAAVGVTGDSKVEPLRRVLKREHLSLYPVIVLSALLLVDGLQGSVINGLAPEVARSLGVGVAALAGIATVKGLASTLAALYFADLVGRRPVRAAVSIITAFGWSIATLFTGFVRTPAGLAGITAIDGASSGSVGSVQHPLLMDYYPPAIRIRINGLKQALVFVGGLGSPLLVALLVGPLHLTWRGVLLVFAVISLLVSCAALGLRDPGFGRWDVQRVRSLVHETQPETGDTVVTEDPPLGFFEAARRLMLMPTMRKVVVATAIASMAMPTTIYFTFFLDERWHVGPTGRNILNFVQGLIAIALLAVVSPLGDRLFRRDPGSVIQAVTIANGFTAVLGVIAVLSPFFVPMVAMYGIAQALPQALGPATSTVMLNVIPPRMRASMIALIGVVAVAAGSTAGNLVLAGLDRRLGLQGAIVVLGMLITPPTLYLMWTASKTIRGDLDATVQATIEHEEIAALRSRGARLPLLACRGIDFSYGQLQVLFDIDLTVDDGEMVALLGTNGAGKSTLLGVISGLNLPSAGSVRLRGADITYVDAERRVGMGLSQVTGGKAVFGPMTVVENLRLYGYSNRRSKAAVQRGIDESFAAFPRLAERRNQLVQTLSGGEQQMLALSQALIVTPQLLCIDELSLGLAPKVVAELLAMVREINSRGTAVILVEQSATVALSLVDHAYFMERGQIRFDGRASDLLQRNDLLRSVFLRGAAAAGANGSDGTT